MRITDLMEAQFQTNIRDVKAISPLRNKYSPKIAGLPKGSFSVVKPDSSDPHMVKKFSKAARSESDEGFKAFVMFLHNNGFNDNIHMPRVYDVKTVRGKDGIAIDSYRLEKLIPFEAVSKEELLAYTDLIGVETPDADVMTAEMIGHMLAGEISDVVRNASSPFKLETLNQACHIVNRAIRATGGAADIYLDNLMFRRTPQGLQLVFSDPLYIPL